MTNVTQIVDIKKLDDEDLFTSKYPLGTLKTCKDKNLRIGVYSEGNNYFSGKLINFDKKWNLFLEDVVLGFLDIDKRIRGGAKFAEKKMPPMMIPGSSVITIIPNCEEDFHRRIINLEQENVFIDKNCRIKKKDMFDSEVKKEIIKEMKAKGKWPAEKETENDNEKSDFIQDERDKNANRDRAFRFDSIPPEFQWPELDTILENTRRADQRASEMRRNFRGRGSFRGRGGRGRGSGRGGAGRGGGRGRGGFGGRGGRGGDRRGGGRGGGRGGRGRNSGTFAKGAFDNFPSFGDRGH